MHKISAQLQESFSLSTTSIATCWQLQLKNGTILGFTNMDFALEVDGIKYHADSGFYPGSLLTSKQLKESDFEAYGILDSQLINEKDILAGLYDDAQVMIFLVDYLNPSHGKIVLKSGYIGDIQIKGQQFIAKICGPIQACDKAIGSLYSTLCRAKFGDDRCKICKTSFSRTGTISEVLSEVKFSDPSRVESESYFAFGEIAFSTGLNAGRTTEIRSSIANVIELMLPLPDPLQVGDKYTIIAGCDKQFSTCITKFNNALNFRGEPHIPQSDRISLW